MYNNPEPDLSKQTAAAFSFIGKGGSSYNHVTGFYFFIYFVTTL